MGMPSSRRHIAALRRSKAAHERSQKLDAGLDGPVTKREYRYLKARAKIYGYELTMPYFKGQRREYYYGVGIEDDWPREPMLGVYVTRNVAKVQRDLTRRARGKYKIRVVRVRCASCSGPRNASTGTRSPPGASTSSRPGSATTRSTSTPAPPSPTPRRSSSSATARR